jgi:serine/threonine protein kinase
MHIDQNELEDYVLGKLPDVRDADIENHLIQCASCRNAAATVRTGDSLLRLLSSAYTNSAPLDRNSDPSVPPRSQFDGTPSSSSRSINDVRSLTIDEETIPVPVELQNHPRYRVLRFIGHGGMGQVWLAEHLIMGRLVAIKLVRSDLTSRSELRERFQRELKSVARLHHPHIAIAYDAEEVGHSLFWVMEWIEGHSLIELLRSGPLPIAKACEIAIGIARGLEHAHRHGLVHRDVKPSNIMISIDGVAKLLDFGLVAATDQSQAITSHGLLMGTPDYIAPEQAEDPRNTTARSDIYSLGCTLYHALSGHVPFQADSTLKKIDGHRFLKPPKIVGLPSSLNSVLDRMISKAPCDRYVNMSEVACELLPFADEEYSQIRSQHETSIDRDVNKVINRRSQRRVWLMGSSAMMALGGIGWLNRKDDSVKKTERNQPSTTRDRVNRLSDETATSSNAQSPKQAFQDSSVYHLRVPSSLGQGTGANYRLDHQALYVDTLRVSNQLWLNYKDHASTDAELRCNLHIIDSSSDAFFKLVLLEDYKSEYSFQLRKKGSPSESAIEFGDVALRKTTEQWKDRDTTNFAKDWISLAIRLQKRTLSAIINDKVIHELPVPSTGKRYACIACWGCIAEVRQATIELLD